MVHVGCRSCPSDHEHRPHQTQKSGYGFARDLLRAGVAGRRRKSGNQGTNSQLEIAARSLQSLLSLSEHTALDRRGLSMVCL